MPAPGSPGAIKSVPKGSPVEKRWKAAEIRTKMAEMRALLATGKDDVAVAIEMGIDNLAYNALKREMYLQDKADINSKSVEEVFIDYRLKQQGCINDLEEMITAFKMTKQYNAMVGAVRAKSDIIDKVIARGQEFGLIEKVPEKKLMVAGVMVAGLSTDELRGFITKQLSGLKGLVDKYGTTDILGAPAAVPAALLPGPGSSPASRATVPAAAKTTAPAFTGMGKPFRAAGGLSKVAGAKAKAAAAREG